MKKGKLYRVDVKISYLQYNDDGAELQENDVIQWFANSFHRGELDDEGRCIITEVIDRSQVEDFSLGYNVYGTDLLLEDIINDLGLNASEMIRKLEKLGYTVKKKK